MFFGHHFEGFSQRLVGLDEMIAVLDGSWSVGGLRNRSEACLSMAIAIGAMVDAKPRFDGQLAELHRKLAQQAEQSAQLISAQELREESERLLKAGHYELGMTKLQSAFRLLKRATETGESGPFPEFQFRLKRDLEETLETVAHEERGFDLTSNSLEALAILAEGGITSSISEDWVSSRLREPGRA